MLHSSRGCDEPHEMIPGRAPPQQHISQHHDPALFRLALVNRSLVDNLLQCPFVSFIVYVPLRTPRSNILRIRTILTSFQCAIQPDFGWRQRTPDMEYMRGIIAYVSGRNLY